MVLRCPVDINNPVPGIDAISLLDIQDEMGGTYLLSESNPVRPNATTTSNRDGRTSISEYYRKPNGYTSINNTKVPLSGQISFADFYCTEFLAIVEITKNTQNVDVRALFGDYWYQNRLKTLIVKENVIVYASLAGYTSISNPASYAMIIADDFAGTLYIKNYGVIMGAAGKYGGSTPTAAEVAERTRTDGSTVYDSTTKKFVTLPYQNNNGGNGSHAIYIGPVGTEPAQDKIVNFENYGIIAAGGGGGGRGAYGSNATSQTFNVNGITVIQKGSQANGGFGGYGYGVTGFLTDGTLVYNYGTTGSPGDPAANTYEITVPQLTNATIELANDTKSNIIRAQEAPNNGSISTVEFAAGPSNNNAWVLSTYDQQKKYFTDNGYTISNEYYTESVGSNGQPLWTKGATATKTITGTGTKKSNISVTTGYNTSTTIYNKNNLVYRTTANVFGFQGSSTTIYPLYYSTNNINIFGSASYTTGSVTTSSTSLSSLPLTVQLNFATEDNQGWDVSVNTQPASVGGIAEINYNLSDLNAPFSVTETRVNDTTFTPINATGYPGGNGGSYGQTGNDGSGTYSSPLPTLTERFNRGIGGQGGYSIFNGNYYVKWVVQGECYPILDQNNNSNFPIGCGYRNGTCTF